MNRRELKDLKELRVSGLCILRYQKIIVGGARNAIIARNPRKTMSDQPVPAKQSKGRGCFFYGCLTAVVLMLVVGIGGFLAVRYGLNKLAAFVERYTETTPMALPAVQMPAAEYEALNKRVTAFTDALNAQTAIPPLILTGDEINALIANHPGWKDLKGKVHVAIEADELKGQVSIPMDEFARLPGMSRLKGRYLNGSAALKVSFNNGTLFVTVQSLQVKGESPPEEIMSQLRAQNLAQNMHQDPKTAEVLRKIESIEIKDGRIAVKAKARE